MEKARALPLHAGFIPNSPMPMPMLDVSDWLLLTTVSTTGGGAMGPLLFLEVLPLLAWCFFQHYPASEAAKTKFGHIL